MLCGTKGRRVDRAFWRSSKGEPSATHPTAPGKPRTIPTETPEVAVVEADMARMVLVEVLVCPFELTRLTLTLLQIAQASGLAGFGHGGRV